MPLGKGVAGDLYLRFDVEFPSSEAAAAWGPEELKALEDLLPAKPKCPTEKRVRYVKCHAARLTHSSLRYSPFTERLGRTHKYTD